MSTAYSLPESPILDSDALYEMIDGVVVELPPMSARAADLAERLYQELHAYGAASGLGRAHHEMLFILNTTRNLRRRPDVSFILKQNREQHPLPATGEWAIIPDLAVEVISPNDRMMEVEDKIKDYFEHEVQQVWIVLPEQKSIKVYYGPTDLRILLESATLAEDELLPGFSLELRSYFE